jgi:hypothetical protein
MKKHLIVGVAVVLALSGVLAAQSRLRERLAEAFDEPKIRW